MKDQVSERMLSIIALAASVIVGIGLFLVISNLGNKIERGNDMILEKVTIVNNSVLIIDRAVNIIDSVKIPAISREIYSLDERLYKTSEMADKASKNAGWANSRASRLEAEQKKLMHIIDSLKSMSVQATVITDEVGGDDPFGAGGDDPFGPGADFPF